MTTLHEMGMTEQERFQLLYLRFYLAKIAKARKR